MGFVSGFTVYVCIWWVLWFMLLPWGVSRPEHPQEGHEPGAPDRPMLRKKFLVTSALALAVWGVVAAMVHYNVYSFDP